VLIAVVSDTHREIYYMEKVLKKIANADVLIHLGDYDSDAESLAARFKGKALWVRGNCDFSSTAKSELLIELAGKKIFITHGHRYDVKYGLARLQYKAEETGADIVLFGHTHKSLVEYQGGVWFINPGSASEARDACESIAFIKIDEHGINPGIEPI
jgi:uncharacterized protein